MTHIHIYTALSAAATIVTLLHAIVSFVERLN